MKFDAWPVLPPGFGSGPLSSRTMSVQPNRERWPTRQLPTMPAPMTTACARGGSSVTAEVPTTGRRAGPPAARTSAEVEVPGGEEVVGDRGEVEAVDARGRRERGSVVIGVVTLDRRHRRAGHEITQLVEHG